MTTTIAIANLKGGVGKSTSTMMIADGLALIHGRRVLIIDADNQASVSRMLIGAERLDTLARERRTVYDLLAELAVRKGPQLADCIVRRVSDIKELQSAADQRTIDIAPSHPRSLKGFADIAQELAARYRQQRVDVLIAELLRPQIEALSQFYDVVLIDCPAGTGPMALAPLRLADAIIAPTMLERNSISALTDFMNIVLTQDAGIFEKLKNRVHILLTMFVKSSPAQQLLYDEIQRRAIDLNALPLTISQSTAVQRAVVHPGLGARRLAREKYSTAFGELEALSSTVRQIIESCEIEAWYAARRTTQTA